MSKISVIVPVYNVEKYLRKCLDSILAQTFQDLEIIVVDDGATDQSPQICEEYAKLDSRVRVIHKENGGLSSARNCGIEAATSPYIGFIDSDDYIKEDMYEVLYSVITENDADIAMCNLIHCYDGIVNQTDVEQEVLHLDSEQAIKMVFEAKKTSVTAVNKLYKKEIFEEIRYPIGKLSEDAFVIVDILMKAKKIVYTSAQEYYYVHRRNSITSSVFKERDMNVIEAYEKNLDLLQKYYPNLEQLGKMRLIWANFYVIDKMYNSEFDLNNELLCKVRKVIKKNLFFILKNKEFTLSRKIAICILCLNKRWYSFFVKTYRKKNQLVD